MDSSFALLFSSIFIANIVLVQFLGICSFLGVSKNMRNAAGMSAAVAFVMVLSAIVTWLVYHYVLLPLALDYLKTIVFILTIASLVQLVEMFLKKKMPALYKGMGVFLPLITTNCTILGIALLNIQKQYDLWLSVVNAAGTAIGYTLALVVFSCIRERLDQSLVPDAMKDLPVALITASCMSLALMGLAGIH